MKRLVVMRFCKRNLHWLRHHGLMLLTLPWLAVLITTYLGVREYLDTAIRQQADGLDIIRSWPLETVFRVGQLFAYESMGEFGGIPLNGYLSWARVLAPAIFTVTALGGLLVYFSEQFHVFLFRWAKGHVVLVGWGSDARDAARAFRAAGDEVLLIHPAPDGELVRFCKEEEILLLEDGFMSKHVHHDRSLIKRINAKRAKLILCIDAEDGQNLDAALRINETELVKDASILCHIEDLTLVSGIRASANLESKGIRLVNLDIARAHDFARKLDPLRGFLVARNEWKPSHVVILGFGDLGRAMALETASASQWSDVQGRKPRVTVVDMNASDREDRFRAQHPEIHNALDIDFKQADIQSATSLQFLREVEQDERYLPVFAVTIDDAPAAVSFALWLAQTRWTRAPRIMVRLTQEDRDAGQIIRDGLKDHLTQAEKANANSSNKGQHELKERSRHYASLIPFGMLNRIRSYLVEWSGDTDKLAKTFHEAYVARVREVEGESFNEHDAKNRLWKDLHACFRHSSREAIAHMPHKLSALGFDWDAMNAKAAAEMVKLHAEPLAKLEHLRWNAERWIDGWTHGHPKDIFAKIHPSLTSWDSLDEGTKSYDMISVETLKQILDPTPSVCPDSWGRRVYAAIKTLLRSRPSKPTKRSTDFDFPQSKG